MPTTDSCEDTKDNQRPPSEPKLVQHTNLIKNEAPLSHYLELVMHNCHQLIVLGTSSLTVEAAKELLFETTNNAATKRRRTTVSHETAAWKKRRTTSHKIRVKSTRRIAYLPTTIHPNLQGNITITPPSLWQSLTPEHRNWFLNYNAAVRQDEKTPLSPTGVTVSYNPDNGNGNTNIPRSIPTSTAAIKFTIDRFGPTADAEPSFTFAQT